MTAQSRLKSDKSLRADSFDVQEHGNTSQHLRALNAGTNVSRYLIIRLLGEGGMGIVYEAFDPELNRKIALKFLRPIETSSRESFQSAQARLLAEAQSLAQISHPNVVAIFDVGTFQDNVFLAMELAHGDTFLKWIEHKQPKSVEIIGKLRLIGEGLAAAHKIGIVHQDIKPDNIIVSPDGTVRLLDFGLASHTSSIHLENAKEIEPSSTKDSDTPTLSSPPSLTPPMETSVIDRRPSTHHSRQRVMGTPSYMSTEQHGGQGVDHYSDQFSFCVTMWESLFGERPFVGTTLQELEQAKLSNSLRLPRRTNRQSKQLIEILSKGLHPDPRCRYSNMSSLLADLDRRFQPRKSPTFFWITIPTAVLIFVSFFFLQTSDSRLSSNDSCLDRQKAFDVFWNSTAKKQIHASFLATNLDYADDSWRKTQRLLEARRQSWNQSYRDTCNQLREQSALYLDTDQRISCLRNRMEETRSFVDTLKGANAEIVQNSVQMSQGLSLVEDCNNQDELETRSPLPSNPRLSRQVSRIRDQLSELIVLAYARRNTEINAKYLAIIELAKNTGFLPLIAEVNYVYGYILSKMGRAQSSKIRLERAISVAERCGHEHILFQAAKRIIHVQAYLLRDSRSYSSLFQHAQAHLLRSGNHALDRASLLHEAAGALMIQNNIDEAYQAISETVEIYSDMLGLRSMETISAIRDFAVISEFRGDDQNSERMYRLAIANTESLLGPTHPELQLPRHNLIRQLTRRSRFSEANIILEQMNESVGKLQTPSNMTQLLLTQSRLALSESHGRHREAIQHSRELIRINQELHGSSLSRDYNFAWPRLKLIQLLITTGSLDEAQSDIDELFRKFAEVRSRGQIHKIRKELHVFSAHIAILRSNWKDAEEHLHHAAVPKTERTLLNEQTAAQADLLLGIVERHHMHLKQAIRLHNDVLEDGKQFFGGNSVHLRGTFIELAQSLILDERFEDAQLHISAIQSSLEQAFGPEHPYLYDVWNTLGDLQIAQNNIKEAKIAWQKAIELFDLENFDPRKLNSICIKYHTLNPREFNTKCTISDIPQ